MMGTEKSDSALSGIRDLAKGTLSIGAAVPEVCIRLANLFTELDDALTADTIPLPAEWVHERAQPDPVTQAMLDYQEAQEIYETLRKLEVIRQRRAERLRATYAEEQ